MRNNDVVFHLLTTGLLPFDAVTGGDVRVQSGVRRHRHFIVRRERGSGFFVKTIEEGRVLAAETMYREAACYACIQSRPELTGLASATPRLLHYDGRRHVLVLELLSGENLLDHYTRTGALDDATATVAGTTLARCQRDASTLVDASLRASFGERLPWILGHGLPAPLVPLVTPPVQAALDLFPRHRETLVRLREQWSPETLVHGDLKFDNCVLDDDGRLHFVDWELVDAGDPLWDAASLLQGYVTELIPDAGEAATFESAKAAFAGRLERVRPSMRALWSAYRDGGGGDAGDLTRCVAAVGARSVQVAFEHAFATGAFGYDSMSLLFAGLGILSDPASARAELFDA